MLHILFALANYSFFFIDMSVYFLFFICIVFVSLFPISTHLCLYSHS